MYVYSQAVLDDAEDMDLYHSYIKAENKALAGQREELSDRSKRRDAAWDNMTAKDARSYDQYAEAATHYLATHNACKSAIGVIEATKARIASYEKRLGTLAG